jgi:phage terminase large subunit
MSDRALDLAAERLGALLGREEQGRDLVELRRRYADESPLGFNLPRLLSEVFGYHGYPKLTEAVAGIVTHPFNALISCNAAGKTFLLGHLAVAFGAMGWKVVCTSVGERSLQTQLMAHAFRAWTTARLPGEFFEFRWRLGRDDEPIVAFASDSISRYGGFHSAVGVVVVVDESQGVERAIVDALRANVTGARRRFLVAGNPLFASGFLYDAARSPTWHTTTISAYDTPNVQAGVEMVPGLVTADWVLDVERDYGRGSNYFGSRALARFPTTEPDSLFDLGDVTAAIERPLAPGEPLVMGIDPSKGGNEWAVAIRAGPLVQYLGAFRETDTMRAVERTVALAARYGITPRRETFYRMGNTLTKPAGLIVVDCAGLGAPIADVLRRLGYALREFNGGNAPTRPASSTVEYYNLRSESYFELRDRLRRGALSLPRSHDVDLLGEELVSTHWQPSTEGKLQLEAKEKIAARLGRSPDRADALTMTMIGDGDAAYVAFARELAASGRSFW